MPTPLPSLSALIPRSGEWLVPLFTDGSGNPTPLTGYNPAVAKLVTATGASGLWQMTVNSATVGPFALGADGPTVVQPAIQATGGSNASITVLGRGPYLVTNPSGGLTITVDTTALSTTGTTPLTTAGSGSEIDQDGRIGTNFVLGGPDWQTEQSGPGGLGHAHVCIASGTGINTASWTFAGLAAGNYQLAFTASGSGLVSSANARIFDGTTYLTTVPLNLSTCGQYFTMALGVSGQPFYTVYSQHGSITVEMADDVGGSDVGLLLYAGPMSCLPVSFAVADYRSPWLVDDAAGTGNNPPHTQTSGTWNGIGGAGNFNGLQAYELAPNAGGTLTWQIPGLPRAQYQFQANYNPDPASRTQHASYQMSDGPSPLGSASLNQESPPAGGLTVTDSASNSFIFAPLATYTVNSGLAKVVLTGQSDGTTNGGAVLVKLIALSQFSEAVTSSVTSYSIGAPTFTVPRLNGGAPITCPMLLWGNSNPPYLNAIANESYAAYALNLCSPSVQLQAGDLVTFAWGAHLFNTTAGSVPAGSISCTNGVGGSLLTIAPTNSRTMKIGHTPNIGGGPIRIYGNYFKTGQPVIHSGSVTALPLTNPDGYPQYTQYDPGWQVDIAVGPDDPIESKTGIPFCPPSGTWIMNWAGVVGDLLVNGHSTNVLTYLSANTGHATGNQVTFSYTQNDFTTYAPNLTFTMMCGQTTAGSFDTGRASFPVGTWTTVTNNGGYLGSYKRNSKIATDKAIFTLGPLPPGTYTHTEFHEADPGGNTATANWIIKEGGVTKASGTLNQVGGSPQILASGVVHAGGIVTVEMTGGTDGYLIADAIQAKLTSTLATAVPPISSAALYPPNINPATLVFGLFDPYAISLMAGASMLRLLSFMGANSSAHRLYSDYATGTEFCFASLQGRQIEWDTISQIGPWNDPNGIWHGIGGTNWIAFLITVDDSVVNQASTRFVTGTPINVSIPGGIIMASGETFAPGFTQFGNLEHDPVHMAPNQFAIGGSLDDIDTAVVQTPVFPAMTLGKVFITFNGAPPQHAFLLCNAVDNYNQANGYPQRCGALINTPQNCGGSLVTAVFGQAGTTLNSGVPIGCEKGDEAFNSAAGFLLNGACAMYAILNSLSTGINGAYGHLSGVDWILAQAALAAPGRGGDFKRMLGAQLAVPSNTLPALAQLTADGAPSPDYIMGGAYLGSRLNNEVPFAAGYETLDIDQVMDLNELTLAVAKVFDTSFAGIRSMIASSANPACKIACYEWAVNHNEVGGVALTAARQARAGHFHPRQRLLSLALQTTLQANGVETAIQYNLDQPPTFEGGYADTATYGLHLAYNSQAGIGDGSDGKYNSLPDLVGRPPGPPNYLLAVSPKAQATLEWVGAASPPPGPPLTPAGPTYRAASRRAPCVYWEDAGLLTLVSDFD